MEVGASSETKKSQRRREAGATSSAADAVAAQFVDAGALAGALKKIEAAGRRGTELHARAGAYAHAVL